MCSIPFSHDFYFSFKKYLQFILLGTFLFIVLVFGNVLSSNSIHSKIKLI